MIERFAPLKSGLNENGEVFLQPCLALEIRKHLGPQDVFLPVGDLLKGGRNYRVFEQLVVMIHILS